MNEQANPWTTKSSEEKYDNAWINITEHQVLNPNGGEGIYGVVHFKNIATGAVVIDDEGFTYLVGQYRYPLNQYSWEIPEGGGQLDVDPLISIQRELKEETGLIASDWTHLQTIHLSNSVSDEIGYLYLAKGLTKTEASPEEDELLEVKKILFEEAVEMVQRGEITDGMSVVGILRAKEIILSEES